MKSSSFDQLRRVNSSFIPNQIILASPNKLETSSGIDYLTSTLHRIVDLQALYSEEQAHKKRLIN